MPYTNKPDAHFERLALSRFEEIKTLRQQLAECEREQNELKRWLEDQVCEAKDFAYKLESKTIELATVTKERDELVEAVLAVCCDPEGRVVIRGSDGDRAVLQAALAKLGADKE